LIRRRKEEELTPADYWLTPYPLGLSAEMDRLFHEFRSDFDDLLAPRRLGINTTRVPAIDLVDQGESYRINAEMPGIKKEDVNIEVGEREVHVSAETKEEKGEEDQDGGYIWRERRYSRFSRTIPLPEPVQTDKTSAELKDGLLIVTIPKIKAQEGKKKVEVK
jgi:HSP20 family protein